MPPTPSPKRFFYLTPGVLPPRPFHTMLASLGSGPLRFLFLELCPPPPGLSILCLAYHGFENPFSALAGLRSSWVGPPLVPAGLCPLRAALFWYFALSGIKPFSLPSLFRTPLGLYHLRLNHPGLRRIWTAPDEFFHPRG
jgi:hypothetical protein